MHEWSLVQALLTRVDEEARKHGAVAVRRLEVSIGELAGVEPALFESAYDLFRTETLCANAPLVLRSVPAEWVCGQCGGALARGEALWCGACESPARLEAGDAIVLERIELEIP